MICNVILNDSLADAHCFSIETTNDSAKRYTLHFSVKAGRDLLKSVWETSEMKASRWKIEHPSDTEDEKNVGLSSEDEAEGLEASPGVARRGTGEPPAPEPQPAPAPAPVQLADDEIIVKKWAIRWMKQQMSALLRGEDLPEGAQGREVAEVPYEVPSVPRGKPPVLYVDSLLGHTTDLRFIWVCIEAKSSHVVSVGKF